METHRHRIDSKKIEMQIKILELKLSHLEKTVLELLVKQEDLDDSQKDLKILTRELSKNDLHLDK